MLTATNLAYFLDPSTQPGGPTPEEIFILFGQTLPRTEQYRGEFRKLHPTSPLYFGGRDMVQYRGEDSNYYQGVPVKSKSDPGRSEWVIGTLKGDESVFVYGQFSQSIPTSDEPMSFVLTRTRFSDQRQSDIAVVSKWMPVASWADEFFPLATDPDDVVEVKVAIARRMFTDRAVKAAIVREGVSRNWDDELNDLRDDKGHDIPQPLYRAMLHGSILVEIGTTPLAVLSENQRRELQGISGVGETIGVQASVPVQGVANQRYNRQRIESLSASDQSLMLRGAMGVSPRTVVSVSQLTPVFAGV